MKRNKFLIIFFLLLFAGNQFTKAMNVAILGNNGNANIVTYLVNNGFTVTDYGSTIPSAATLTNFQAVVLLRMNGNSDLSSWVTNGGMLITEWSAADWAVANVLTATVSSSGAIGGGTPVTFSGSTLGIQLATGLSNPYTDGGATEYFYSFSSIGSGVETLATRPTNIPAIIGGGHGSGYTFIIGYDWADGFPSTSSNSGILLKNALNSGATGQPTLPANPSSVTANYNILCNGASTTLTANGAVGTVYWYTVSCGGTATSPATGNTLTVNPSVTTTYYARNYNNSQFSAGCASIGITVNSRPTVANLQASGTDIKWYNASTGGTQYTSPASTYLVNGQTYYASQTVNGVESTLRFAVLVTMSNPAP